MQARHLALYLMLITAAQAQHLVNEVRVGVHYVEPCKSGPEKNPVINLEILLQPLAFDILSEIFCPRPHLGMSISARGSTSQFYGGLTWFILVKDWFFIEPSFGGEVHNANLKSPSKSHKTLGSRLLFRESVSFGKQFDNLTVSAILDHASNASLSHPNCGMTTLGLRLGVKI